MGITLAVRLSIVVDSPAPFLGPVAPEKRIADGGAALLARAAARTVETAAVGVLAAALGAAPGDDKAVDDRRRGDGCAACAVQIEDVIAVCACDGVGVGDDPIPIHRVVELQIAGQDRRVAAPVALLEAGFGADKAAVEGHPRQHAQAVAGLVAGQIFAPGHPHLHRPATGSGDLQRPVQAIQGIGPAPAALVAADHIPIDIENTGKVVGTAGGLVFVGPHIHQWRRPVAGVSHKCVVDPARVAVQVQIDAKKKDDVVPCVDSWAGVLQSQIAARLIDEERVGVDIPPAVHHTAAYSVENARTVQTALDQAVTDGDAGRSVIQLIAVLSLVAPENTVVGLSLERAAW